MMREDWKEARIDELGTGLRPVLKAGPFGSSVTKATYQASGYKVYGQQEVVAKDLSAEAYFVSEATFSRHKSCAVKPGDLLMTMMGTIGRVYRVPEGAPEGIINPRLVRIAFDTSRILPEYAEAALEQPPLQRLLNRRSHGGTMQGLNIEALASIRLPLPPKPEQRKIAEILRTWDTAIQKTEQLIAAKERHYSHELSRLISRGQHPHAHVGTVAEEVSARNRGGKPALLGDFLTESREPDTDQDPARRLTVRLHLQGVEARPVRGTESDGATAYFRRRAGQLIYGKQNIFRGAIGIVPPELDGYASTQDLPAFDIGDGIDPQWLYFWLSRKDFYTSLEALAAGSGSKRLHPEEFFKVHIYIPDLATQTAIARYLNALREEIDLLGQSVAALKTQKRGLMQKLLTGQWRLKVDHFEAKNLAKENNHG